MYLGPSPKKEVKTTSSEHNVYWLPTEKATEK